MYIDLLNSDNYLSVNITLAKALGLEGAVYCSELFNIVKKAQKKNKLIDGYLVKVDREYIQERTTLTVEKQLQIESAWKEMNLLSKSQDDIISLNIPLFVKLISDIDEINSEELTLLKNKLVVKTDDDKKEIKRTAQKINLKNHLTYPDAEVQSALQEWIESVFARPQRSMTKAMVDKFIGTLKNYTSDKETIFSIIEIATKYGYVSCLDAIKVHEDRKQQKLDAANRMPRVTVQQRATQLGKKY